MKTVYIQRQTEDLHEKMDDVRKEVDFFIDCRSGSKESGLGELADILQTWSLSLQDSFGSVEAYTALLL